MARLHKETTGSGSGGARVRGAQSFDEVPQVVQDGYWSIWIAAREGRHMAQRVLIVDDEQNIVISLEYLMKRAGYEVLTAGDGEEALQMIAAHRPDLVLLDVMMPKRNGYEVCQRIREHPDWRQMKIIMLSAKGRDVEVSKGVSVGADLYLTKPFSNAELVAHVKALLAEA
jgi:DNA-binding response OmpR family regulator